MTTNTKLSLIAATFAAITAGAVRADDQQLKNQLALQRTQMDQESRMTTVAVYTNDRGVGRRTAQETQDIRTEGTFELRSNAHGESFAAYVPVK